MLIHSPTPLERLENLFLIQRDLLRSNDLAIRLNSDRQTIDVIKNGASAREDAFLALARSMGSPSDHAQHCIEASARTTQDYDEALKRLMAKQDRNDAPLLPLLAMRVPLQLLQKHLENLSEQLMLRRRILDQTTPITVGGVRTH